MSSVRTSARPEYRPFPNLGHRNALQQRFEVPTRARVLELPPGPRLLEVGCGRGAALPALARHCRPSRLVGLDVEPSFLAEAAAALEREDVSAELVVGDVRALPFADASFDVVVDFGTLYHIADARRALAEIERVLAPRGLFVHETPLGQLFAHPVRSLGRKLPWTTAPRLGRERTALLWSSKLKRA